MHAEDTLGIVKSTAFVSYVICESIGYVFILLVTLTLSKRILYSLNLILKRTDFLRKTQLDMMKFIPKVLESHEVFTGHHVKHTVQYVELIARQLKVMGYYKEELTEEFIEMISAAANLHDIGKIHIPDNILNKNGKFTDEEFAMMKKHPEEGKKLIEYLPEIRNGIFNEIAIQMAYCHHEKYDGTGYPRGIKGNDIPLCARIMAVADVTDALISWRPYKEPFGREKVIDIIKTSSGTHFEPCIVEAALALMPSIFKLSEDFKKQERQEEEQEFAWRNLIKGNSN